MEIRPAYRCGSVSSCYRRTAMTDYRPNEREFIHLADVKPRFGAQIAWERRRGRKAHWFSECAAEFVSGMSPSRYDFAFKTTPPGIDRHLLLCICR